MIDSPAMRWTYECTLRRAIERDGNHPSVIAWVLFNETWGLTKHDTAEGQAWLRAMYHLAKELDPSRLVEDNSPCNYDHVESDLNSWHFYINDWDRARRHVQRVVDETRPGGTFNYVGEHRQTRAPLLNSEYAGISARMGDQDVGWSFKYLTSELRRHDKVCGYIYTELTDVEWEHNGFVNYDRSAKEFGYSLRDLTGADFVGLDGPPCQTMAPGSELAGSLFVSHWGAPMGATRVCWRLELTDRLGRRREVASGAVAAAPRRFGVTDLGELRVTLPDEPGLAALSVALEADGEIRCRNYVNVELRAGTLSPIERVAGGHALRFAPGDYSASSWPQPQLAPEGAKFAGLGTGWVEYDVAVPADIGPVGSARLLVEAGSRAGLARVEWRSRSQASDYPQTEERKHPSDLVVTLDGAEVARTTLPDDPADARGVLSHHRGYNPGSYGFLLDLPLPPLKAGISYRLRFDATAGLALYGETLGAYPLGPTALLEGQ